MLSPDFKEFVQLLNANHVEYLLVGGYAVGFHGHPRYTGDLDIWINNDEDTAQKVLQCLVDFGFGSLGLSLNDFTQKESVIQLGYPPFRIDILTDIDGVTFEECFKNRKIIEFENTFINLINLDDLKKNKRASGRNRDLDDLENLA